MAYRDYYKKPTLGNSNNALVFLFGVNAFIFILLRFLKIVYDLDYGSAAYAMFNNKVLYWFTVSPHISFLVKKIWCVVLYMFAHYSIVGFISNMIWLWAFGYILQDLVGNKKLIPIYLYSGFFSGLVFIITATYIPFFSYQIAQNYLLEGCNASILAIAVAATTIAPKYKMFQHIGEGFSLWILTAIYALIDIAYIASNNLALGVAHITAALIGYVYIKQLQQGKNWGLWMENILYKVDDVFNPEKKYEKAGVAGNHYYKQTVAAFNKTENVTEKKLNEILDKINTTGYDKLSKEEKDFLDRVSQQ